MVRNAAVARKGSQLSTTVQLRPRLLSARLTAQHRGNHWDYVSIMLAVRCLLFAAVCARCAETGKKPPALFDEFDTGNLYFKVSS